MISITEKKPIKEFNLNQTMYSLVTGESKDDLDLKETGFMGNDMSYNNLIISADKLAQTFYNIGIKNGDNVAILTISMPIVQQSLLSLSKIGATMSWINLRSKPKDVVRYINSSNCKTIYNDLGKFDISLVAPLHYRYMYKQLTELEIDNILDEIINLSILKKY